MTTHRLLWYSTQEETRSLFPKRNYSSLRWKIVDYQDTRPMMRQDLYSLKGITHPRDDENRLLQYSKMQLKVANNKLREKATTRSVFNSKKKVLYIQMLKVLQWTHIHTRAKRILQQNVQAYPSGTGSKPLITLSAIGFISATYPENFSSEQPTATPSPIRAKFAEGRKDFTNPKAWAKKSLEMSEKTLLIR